MDTTVNLVFALMLAFTLKHFIADYPLQAFPYMYRNKGTYLHPGGIVHAGVHAIFTAIALIVVCIFCDISMTAASVGIIALLSIFDMIAHYHIDWAKMNINKKMGWGPNTHEEFWVLLGADQLLHGLTYIWLSYEFVKGI